MRKVVVLFLLITSLFAYKVANIDVMIKKGKIIVDRFCDKDKLPEGNLEIKDIIKELKENSICGKLNYFHYEAVALYLKNQKRVNLESIKVPKDAKCPVCGMFVSKYPKWAAMMKINGKKHYFDGVKDMMKYYFFDGDFKYDRNKIEKMEVTDYYTLKAIDAKSAWYVYDSKKYGPMGRELIPFATKKEALNFINDYKGELMRFSDITPQKVMALDGIEMK